MCNQDAQCTSEATIERQLEKIQAELFVNRESECRWFSESLNGERDWRILNLCGPIGVGKTTLVDAFRRITNAANAVFIKFNTPDLGAGEADYKQVILNQLHHQTGQSKLTSGGWRQMITDIANQQQVIIAFDSSDDDARSHEILWRHIIPVLPEQCMVVLVTRTAWHYSANYNPLWAPLIKTMQLSGFKLKTAQHYCQQHGLSDPHSVERLWRRTGGMPLALFLADELARQDEHNPLDGFYDSPLAINELNRRWQREVVDEKIFELTEAASLLQCFNQEALEQLIKKPISSFLFQKFTATSFIHPDERGWTMNEFIRDAVIQQFKQRSPTTLEFMRSRALKYYVQLAKLSNSIADRRDALMEFFHLMDKYTGTSLANTSEDDTYSLATATAEDIPEIDAFLAQNNGHDATTAPPNCSHIIKLMPDAITLLRSTNGLLKGVLIVLPINRTTMDYLGSEAVTGAYLSQLNELELQACNTPPYHTENRFIRLICLSPHTNESAHQAMYRHLIELLAEPARFIAVQQTGINQQFLSRLGFELLQMTPKDSQGRHRPHLNFYIADVRSKRLGDFMETVIKRRIELAEDMMVPSPCPQPYPAATGNRDSAHIMLNQLTEREREVAMAAVEGLANPAIADRLGVSEVTVKKHMSRIFAKLKVNNRRELIKQYWSTQPNQN